MFSHELQLFILLCMDLLQAADSLHQCSLLWVQLLSFPLLTTDNLHGLRLGNMLEMTQDQLINDKMAEYYSVEIKCPTCALHVTLPQNVKTFDV